jgi:hypothetical protein
MGKNSRDRILDACLSELMGGQRPPDLSDRILRNLNQPRLNQPRRRAGGPLLVLAVAASLLLGTVGFLYVRFLQTRGGNGEHSIAETPEGTTPDQGTPNAVASKSQDPTPAKTASVDPGHGAVAAGNAKASTNHASQANQTLAHIAPELVEPLVAERAPVTLVRSSDAEILQAVNAAIRSRWQAAGVSPSAAATDAEWCRRVFLDVIGRIPSYKEITDFVADKSADKREKLVDRLMASDVYLDEFARNWSNVWTNLLLGRDDDTRGGVVNREGFQQFVRRAVLHNKPYDQFVHDLLTATGSNQPGADDYNGAVSFVLQNLSDKAVPATAKTARVFLGVQVQCTQCHNHPFNDAKQSQFWQLNAFFRQAQPKREGRDTMRLVNVTFPGEGSRNPKEAEVYYEERSGLLKVAYPAFVDGTRIDPSGDITDVNRREELARLIVKSEYFSQAIVNRAWSHFLGYGFTRPVDDMGPHNPPTHPEVLERLSRQFVAHNYNLQKLYRWIVLSEPYSLSSRVKSGPGKAGAGNGNLVDDPDTGTAPLFSRFYLRQMRPEELFESLRVMTHADGMVAEDVTAIERRKSKWMQQFTISYETDDVDETTTYNGSVALTLDMWNGELMNRAVSLDKGTLLQQLASDAKIKDKIGYLYMAALGRQPTAQEKTMLTVAWKNHGGNGSAALQDLFWVVLNSNEFVMNR